MNLRKYGTSPFSIVLVHGGPGAPGSMAPVALELSGKYGILEPFQSKNSIKGQLSELKEQIAVNANVPVTLVGHSWGAWLSFIFSASYPDVVRKLILINCGSFEDKYLSLMHKKRKNNLTPEENKKASIIYKKLLNASSENRGEILNEFGKLMGKADSFCPIENKSYAIDFQPEVFKNCMEEINLLRTSGDLLNIGRDIKCPVIAIHGEDDPHPYEGVEKPLSNVLENFSFYLLKKCGHSPWNEKYAREDFYRILYENL